MALTTDEKKEVRRLARLEAAAIARDPGRGDLYPANSFSTTTGRYVAGGIAGTILNEKIIALDAAEGGDPFAP